MPESKMETLYDTAEQRTGPAAPILSVDVAVGNVAMHGDFDIAPDSSAPDSWLMKYCADIVDLMRQLDGAFEVRRPTHTQKRHITELDYKAASLRQSIVTIRATTLAGHHARALAFQRADCGRLLAKANAREGFENRILAALICDLLQLPGQPLPGDKAPTMAKRQSQRRS